ncbi:hypothetical protein [Mesorhizobium sp.]|uniref:hypothetical protein n=1 Tax=Mesorhizobium sp. TaxID=1871066 RepID=UPI0011F497E3|nr:hypothetical protein [Mesorhizobium sp.]TIS56837.1 MAG: hypothetical protein E5W91_16285 [Mesorhizobium sp.]TIS87940.1 MAG: hypothetical protein E5W89_22255 [Mesorhizobium sp.]
MFFKLSKGLNAPPERISTDVTPAAGGMPAAGFDSPFYQHFHMEDGPMFDPCKIPGSRNLHERKMATWALLIGETYSSAVHAETRRRPHRGMLPDVDFSRAVPDHSRPSLVRRIVGMIRPGAKSRAGETVPSGSSSESVGEKPATPYIARSRTGDPGDSGSPVLDAMRSQGATRPQDATRSRDAIRSRAA